ncbi:hypothetical protein WDW86_16515 [Bdellovibrionota bacterium FG-2]
MKIDKSVLTCLLALGTLGPTSLAFATAPKESCKLETTLKIERSLIESPDQTLFVEVTFRFHAETPYARIIEKKLLTIEAAGPSNPSEASFAALAVDAQISSVLYERTLQDVLVSVFLDPNTRTGFPIAVERFLPERVEQGETSKEGIALVCTLWAS